jgi:hypothetical protein
MRSHDCERGTPRACATYIIVRMDTDIPREQYERLQPIVDMVLSDLRRMAATLPVETDMALTYEAGE